MVFKSSDFTIQARWNFIFCLLTLMVTSCKTTKKLASPSDLQHEISLYLDTVAVFRSGFAGLVIQDAESGEILHNRNGEKYFTPASNIKLLTLYSALKMLPDSLPALLFTENDSIIYIWGAGDPTVLHPDFPESPVLHFLKEKGHKKIFFSDDNFYMPHFGEGWMWDDYRYAFQPEISPLPLYGNVAELSIGDKSLKIFPVVFSDSVIITSDGDPFFGRLLNNNRFIIPEERLIRKSRNYKMPYRTSGPLTAKLLSIASGTDIIYLKNGPVRPEKVLYGSPKDTVLRRMMYQSDNLFAEQLLLCISGQLSDSLNSNTGIRHVEKKLLSSISQPIRWSDGSGLSRYNLATPAAMCSVLDSLYRLLPRGALFKFFNPDGMNGTLNHSGKSVASYLYAKTGSMAGVYNLSGYLIADSGRVLTFSFMNNHFYPSGDAIRKHTEEILLRIKRYY